MTTLIISFLVAQNETFSLRHVSRQARAYHTAYSLFTAKKGVPSYQHNKTSSNPSKSSPADCSPVTYMRGTYVHKWPMT